VFPAVIAQFAPRPHVRTLDWAAEHARNEFGDPYSHNQYPHIGAPGGPFDALDCSQYFTIWLQWGSRLGKTFLAEVALMKLADTNPCPMMFASVDEKLATEVTARTYRMLELCRPLRECLLPKNRRRQNFVDLRDCRMSIAWSRSVSTLADKPVKFGHANEVDKWDQASTSTEADPLKLFSDRFKQFPIYKRIIESTPAMKQSSRIERGRLGSTNCMYWVPCPHCGVYQTLKMENLIWDKTDTGKSDKTVALQTARYRCPHCQGEALDNHRGLMMRAGVWVPEGCEVDSEWAKECARAWKEPNNSHWTGWKDSPWVKGTPLRDGRDAGYHLSSLYALARTWGEIAEEWVGCQKSPQNLRNFVNQWLAETWATREQQDTWERLGNRIISGTPRYAVPVECQLITLGGDIQNDRVVYVVEAWGESNRSHTLDYGEVGSLADLLPVLERPYHREGGGSLYVELALIDSGFHPKDVYQFCKRMANKGRKVWPCKGSSTALNAPYRKSVLGEDTLAPGAPIVHVDTLTTQDWIAHQLTLDPKKDGGFNTLFHDSLGNHQYFLEQLLNETCVQKLTTTNTTKEVWERIDDSLPNDFRDCKRYAFAGKLLLLRGGEVRRGPDAVVVKGRPVETKEKPKGGVRFLERPGGWIPKR
jgi:phage terminase large subunit GpA-like protein